MPKRSDINSVLVIGAGPIVIGQACEFDYSGTQACRVLKEEGIRVVLLNSNPATIMTDPQMADATYIEPVDAQSAAAIIEKERVDAVLSTMGGQTALNCAIEMHRQGIIADQSKANEKSKPLLIGANVDCIRKAEDRQEFKVAMQKIGLRCSPSAVVSDLHSAQAELERIGFPAIIRPSFTLGGSGGGIAYNSNEFNALVAHGLSESPTGRILMERSLIGWKEFEMEVVRDSRDNCIIVCSIENVNPMGVHTGDSITVAPAQTLTDKEYQRMRDAAIAVVREIGVDTGGANVQFALNPVDGEMVVIEMNPRVSRSSALASKATGFPIAKVATKLAIGYTLDEIANDITAGKTPASFEPSIDYIVTKVPRFDFAKFSPTEDVLTTQMRSVGEVMAIGRTFAESLQKALYGLEIGESGLIPSKRLTTDGQTFFHPDGGGNVHSKQDFIEGILQPRLSRPHSRQIFDIAVAFQLGMAVAEVYQLTRIDSWFLAAIKTIVEIEGEICETVKNAQSRCQMTAEQVRCWKRFGFSDKYIDQLGEGEYSIHDFRQAHHIYPVYKRIDTCAGEFPTDTAYLYSTYESECELAPTNQKKVIVLGSGPNRIGQGIEFDYCCVHSVIGLKEAGFETIMVNCNPETVSTDVDIADRLFFEPLTVEHVMEIIRREQPVGVIVQFGGQTPLSIAAVLESMGAPIIGTTVDAIDRAESRERFKLLLNQCQLKQPDNVIVGGAGAASREPSTDERASIKASALRAAESIGYPLVVRPSYVLGGRAMEIVDNADALQAYLDKNLSTLVGDILLDKFLQDAVEVDVDAVRDSSGACLIAGVMEHIERAGIHSGDSACSLPPYSLSTAIIEELERQTRMLADALNVVGLMNVQFAIRNDAVYVLEVNPRASRTVPFVSKATGLPIAKIAAKVMVGLSLAEQGILAGVTPPYYAVKEAVFPFNKFPGVDVLLGPEMKSTGESMGIGENFASAFFLSQEAISPIPQSGTVIFSVCDADKASALIYAKALANLGYTVMATAGTANYFSEHGLAAEKVNKVKEGRPHIVDLIVSNKVQLVINTEGGASRGRQDSFAIRRAALVGKVIYFTTIAGVAAAVEGLSCVFQRGRPSVRSLQTWHQLSNETIT